MSERLEEHLPGVYRFALRLTGNPHAAEDLTQEAFLRAWRQARQLRVPQAARAWLLRITMNVWRDQLRRGQSPVARAGPLGDYPESLNRIEEWMQLNQELLPDPEKWLRASERKPRGGQHAN